MDKGCIGDTVATVLTIIILFMVLAFSTTDSKIIQHCTDYQKIRVGDVMIRCEVKKQNG